MQSAALIEANLKKTESKLAQVRVALAHEKEQRALMEDALNAKVLAAEKVRDSSLQAVALAQREASDLKKSQAGEFIFYLSTAFPLVLFFCLF